MAELGGKISGRVKVGPFTPGGQGTLAPPSAPIAQKYPDVQLSACEGYTDTLIEWVVSGQLDVAIVNLPLRKVPLAAHHILDEEMVRWGLEVPGMVRVWRILLEEGLIGKEIPPRVEEMVEALCR